jgi:hypothetical protein
LVVLNETHTVCFPFCTKQPGKHEVPYKTSIQTASFQTKQAPKQDLVLVFAAVCQPISNRANLLEIQGELLFDEGKQLQTKAELKRERGAMASFPESSRSAIGVRERHTEAARAQFSLSRIPGPGKLGGDVRSMTLIT